MDVVSWKPIDLIVGGMLTAGVAFGVYKLGINNHKKAAEGSHLNSSNIQAECIALAGRHTSELEVSVIPQTSPRTRRLALSLAASMGASQLSKSQMEEQRSPNTSQDYDVDRPPGEVLLRRRSWHRRHSDESKELSGRFDKPDQTPPKRKRFQTEYSPLVVERTPPELAKQLQHYRDTLDKWTAESEAKIEKIERQRMELSTELHATRETLGAEKRLRAEAEQKRHRAEVQLKEVEERLKMCSACQERASRKEKEVACLQLQVRDMEEQLEGLYLNNVVTPRHAVQDNVAQQQHLIASLQEAEDELKRQQQEIQDLENDVTNVSAQLNKARKDGHQLAEDNARFQKQLLDAQHAAKHLLALLYERTSPSDGEGDGEERSAEEMMALLNLPDSDLPLDKLLQCLTSLLFHS